MNFITVKESLAVFIEANDEQLDRIIEDRVFYLDEDFVDECAETKGDNCVIVLLICKNGTKEILKGIDKLMAKYKTVNFWNRRHERFYKKRRFDHEPSERKCP